MAISLVIILDVLVSIWEKNSYKNIEELSELKRQIFFVEPIEGVTKNNKKDDFVVSVKDIESKLTVIVFRTPCVTYIAYLISMRRIV